MADLCELLKSNRYPGRGIVLGLTPDGKSGVAVYFVMGRSENSRNRVFSETSDGIETEAADPAKLQDPRLIIYRPVRRHGDTLIVTNGDQTDTIYEHLVAGGSFENALRTRTFEPDAPNYTPRISGLMTWSGATLSYRLSILKSADGNPASARRFLYEYQPLQGRGHFIHTYQGDGDPLPSFVGEPIEIAVPEDLANWMDSIWESLDAENKVSLFLRAFHADGSEETYICNRFTKTGQETCI